MWWYFCDSIAGIGGEIVGSGIDDHAFGGVVLVVCSIGGGLGVTVVMIFVVVLVVLVVVV